MKRVIFVAAAVLGLFLGTVRAGFAYVGDTLRQESLVKEADYNTKRAAFETYFQNIKTINDADHLPVINHLFIVDDVNNNYTDCNNYLATYGLNVTNYNKDTQLNDLMAIINAHSGNLTANDKFYLGYSQELVSSYVASLFAGASGATQFNTFSDLNNYTPGTLPKLVYLKGYTATNDGGQGYVWITTYDAGYTTDNILAWTKNSRSYRRVHFGEVNLKLCEINPATGAVLTGAKGDGTTDDADAIQKILDTKFDIYANTGTNTYLMGKGTKCGSYPYSYWTSLIMYNGQKINLNGATFKLKNAANASIIQNDTFINSTKASDAMDDDIAIYNGTIDQNAINQELTNPENYSFDPAVYLGNIEYSSIFNLKIKNSWGFALYFTYHSPTAKSNNIFLKDITVNENTVTDTSYGAGISLNGDSYFVKNLTINNTRMFPGNTPTPWGCPPNAICIDTNNSGTTYSIFDGEINYTHCAWPLKLQSGSRNVYFKTIHAIDTYLINGLKFQGTDLGGGSYDDNENVMVDTIIAEQSNWNGLYFYANNGLYIKSYTGMNNGLGNSYGGDLADVQILNSNVIIDKIVSLNTRGWGVIYYTDTRTAGGGYDKYAYVGSIDAQNLITHIAAVYGPASLWVQQITIENTAPIPQTIVWFANGGVPGGYTNRALVNTVISNQGMSGAQVPFYVYDPVDGEYIYDPDSGNYLGCFSAELGTTSRFSWIDNAAVSLMDWVGDWYFDDGSGSQAVNSAFPAGSGTLMDMDTGSCWGTGYLSFEGQNDRVHVADINEMAYIGGQMTVLARIYRDAGETDGGYIVSKYWNGNGDINYFIRIEGNGNLTFWIGGATYWVKYTNTALPSGQWSTVAMTVDVNRTVTGYLNGTQLFSEQHTVTNWTPPNGDSNVPLCIGSLYPYNSGWAGSPDLSFKGKIDELRIHKSKLSGAEITPPTVAITVPSQGASFSAPATINITATASDVNGTISKVEFYNNDILLGTDTSSSGGWTYSWANVAASGSGGIHLTAKAYDDQNQVNLSNQIYCTVTDSALKLYWKLDELSGSTATDTSGSGYNGSIQNSPTHLACKVNYGLSLNGTSQYVMKTSAVNLPKPQDDQTESFWYYVSSNPSPAAGARNTALTITRDAGDASEGIGIGFINSGGVKFGVWKNSNKALIVSTSTLPAAGAWHHVTYVKNGSNKYLYIDGQVNTSSNATDSSVVGSIYAGRNNYQTNPNYWPGKLDEIRSYNRVLSGEEISALEQGKQ
ncbi:MAG: LamG-like jellyroll fold domain-containing protein [Candidatus Ratteibacteria bacterium]|jgi:hypothetical protein